MRRSLRGRVLAVLVLATVLPTLLVGAVAIFRARADLEREVVRGNLALIRALGSSLDSTLQGTRRALELAAGQWADERSEAGAPALDAAASERLLRRLRRQAPLIAGLSIVDVDGTHLSGDPIRLGGALGAHTFGGYVGDVVFEDGRPSVRLVTQARSRTGELVGVFVADLDLGFVAETLAAARLGPGARLLVVDGDGVPVARSDRATSGTSSLRGVDPAVDRALGQADEGWLTAGGNVSVYRNLSSYQSMRGVRWAILLEQPEREAYALARATTRDTIVIGALVLVAALAIGSLLATRLTRPLRDLALRADAVAEGTGGADVDNDDLPPPPIDAPGEIGVLAQRLEDMAHRIGERERLQQALARGDRLAAIGTMAASVAHEVNNPLTTVLGYARLLGEDKPADHPDRAGLDLIAGEAERMKSIIGGLLDYARRPTESAAPEAADVNELVRRTAMLLAPSARRARVELQLALTEPLPPAVAEAYALQQVFFNLAHNAVQAMPDGGVCTLASRLASDGRAIEVLVSDQGPGVPAASRERIFEPFYTTKASGSGTGLGLAVCKHLVAGFRGTLAVDDGDGGGGARFVVTIPAAG
jgi:signal transduction histidine kinase